MNAQLPVACCLTDKEFRERRDLILVRLAPAILEVREQADGFGYRFAPQEETLEALVQIVNLERKCCPFLTFRITVEAGEGALWLEVGGPDGTKDFLAALFPTSPGIP